MISSSTRLTQISTQISRRKFRFSEYPGSAPGPADLASNTFFEPNWLIEMDEYYGTMSNLRRTRLRFRWWKNFRIPVVRSMRSRKTPRGVANMVAMAITPATD